MSQSPEYRLWSLDVKGKRWGIVSPRFLHFATKDAGEVVADRYRALYPHHRYEVSRITADGFKVSECEMV